MTKAELKKLDEKLSKFVAEREKLGGYDVNAETILTLAVTLLSVVQHLRETPKPKK